MNFDFSDEQKLLKEQARKVLEGRCSIKAVRAVLDDDATSFDRGLWREIAGLGWLGAAIAEDFGGVGLGRLALCVLAEEIGRALAPIPFSSTVYLLAEALTRAGTDPQRIALLPRIASGEVVGALAVSEGPGPTRAASLATVFDGTTLSGVKVPVTDGDAATHALVLAREGDATSLVLVDLDQPRVRRTPVRTFDSTRGHARLHFDGARAERIGDVGAGWSLCETLQDGAAVLISFEQIGGAQACLDMAVDYAKNRYAFSRPIGSFQAIKHKLADMFVAIELARSNAYYGAWAISTEAPELPLAAAAARIAASDAYYLASKENIQTHGGMGFTWDVDCHLHYRRAKLLALQVGAPAIWKDKLVRRLETGNAG